MSKNNEVAKSKTDVEIIARFITEGDNIVLTERQQKKFDRLKDCHGFIKQYGNKFKVVKAMLRMHGDESYTQRDAYTDISDCNYMFGTMRPDEMNLHIDIVLGFIAEDLRRCEESNDMKHRVKLLQLYKECISEFMSDDSRKYKELQPQSVILGNFTELLGVTLPSDWREIVDKRIEKKLSGSFVEFEDMTEKEDDASTKENI